MSQDIRRTPEAATADGGRTWIETQGSPEGTRTRTVTATSWQFERTQCFCCSCDPDGTYLDPYCRNHGFAGSRPCLTHGMAGETDENEKMPAPVGTAPVQPQEAGE